MPEIPLPNAAIGIDFGGTTVKIGVTRGGLLVRRAASLPTLQFTSADALMDAIFQTVEELRAAEPGVAAVGAGLPGIVDSREGIVHHLTNVAGWENVPLRDLLRERTGLLAAVENDANAMTYAEWKYGAGRGRQDVVCVTLGTGVGGGLILEGRLYRGAQMGAGEIGHMSIDYRGVRGPYGNFGGLEEYVGNHQIAERAMRGYREAGIERDLGACAPLDLANAARAGDPVAGKLWEEIGEILGAALANVVWLINPDAIILGGGVAQAGDLLFGPVKKAIVARTSRVFSEKLELLPASLGSDAGLIGAGEVALDSAPAR